MPHKLHLSHRVIIGWAKVRSISKKTPCSHDLALGYAYFLRVEGRFNTIFNSADQSVEIYDHTERSECAARLLFQRTLIQDWVRWTLLSPTTASSSNLCITMWAPILGRSHSEIWNLWVIIWPTALWNSKKSQSKVVWNLEGNNNTLFWALL